MPARSNTELQELCGREHGPCDIDAVKYAILCRAMDCNADMAAALRKMLVDEASSRRLQCAVTEVKAKRAALKRRRAASRDHSDDGSDADEHRVEPECAGGAGGPVVAAGDEQAAGFHMPPLHDGPSVTV